MFRLTDRLGLQIAGTLDPLMYSVEEPIYPIFVKPEPYDVDGRIPIHTDAKRSSPTWDPTNPPVPTP